MIDTYVINRVASPSFGGGGGRIRIRPLINCRIRIPYTTLTWLGLGWISSLSDIRANPTHEITIKNLKLTNVPVFSVVNSGYDHEQNYYPDPRVHSMRILRNSSFYMKSDIRCHAWIYQLNELMFLSGPSLCRDIYYAKYYGKEGGMASRGKNEIRI